MKTHRKRQKSRVRDVKVTRRLRDGNQEAAKVTEKGVRQW